MAYDTHSLVTAFHRVGSAEGPLASGAGFSAAMHISRSADPVLTVIGAGYISDGLDKGVAVNDIVFVVDDNLGLVDMCIVTVVTAAGLVTMVNGT